ncbi:hypothetical protein PHLCEN_2v11881 [Hermanssonia centrifuga]|uniref:Uncharacterized protein n=1 Tax=Hermanssonia centrifuga TaxID=98765 RepID=A0A2R6NIU5_9APHY|nr:hypothetical protein PHLCEN_2v11881 [Hermanssonia centrifuga]
MPINTASLKQRLASLTSLNIANGSESYSGPGSPSTPKWRPFFNRRNTEDGMGTTFYGQDQIQEVMTRLIFQAGVDYESVHLSLPSITLMNEVRHQNQAHVRTLLLYTIQLKKSSS